MSPWVVLSNETIVNAYYCKGVLEGFYGEELEIPEVIQIIVKDWIGMMVEGIEKQ